MERFLGIAGWTVVLGMFFGTTFITLKVCGVIEWSWFLILAPIYVPWALLALPTVAIVAWLMITGRWWPFM